MAEVHSPLVGARELAAALHEPGLVLLDIRSAVDGGGRAAFEAGHVPGAIHSDYVEGGWRAVRGGGAGMLPQPEALAALIGGLGIRPESRVVVISAGTSAGDLAAASRVFWTLRVAGHRKVEMLDGGVAAWTKSGLPLEAGARPVQNAQPYPVSPDTSLRATLEEVEEAVRTGSAVLVDTRNRASFEGREQSRQAARAGRLPGSRHGEGARAFDPATGRLKSLDELRDLFRVEAGPPVIPFCNTGQQAATNWFVLSQVLGRPEVKLYDGSMSEWTHDPARPVETGPEKG